MTLTELLQKLRDIGDYDRLRLDVMSQFGPKDDPYLGASLLPEQNRDENAYTEEQIRYAPVIANAGASDSPAQQNTGGRLYGEFKVSFGNTNVADSLTAKEYDRILKLMMMSDQGGNDRATFQALARIIKFFDNSIREPMMALNELYRWQAIVDGNVKRRGSNGYAEDVVYPTPANHRVTIPGGTVAAKAGWYTETLAYDPMNDFLQAQMFLRKKGYRISRIISNFSGLYAFMSNAKIRDNIGGSTIINTGGAPSRVVSSVSIDGVNAYLQANQLPAWEVYDKVFNYRNPASQNVNGIDSSRFLDRKNGAISVNPVILVCTTGRDESMIDFGDRSSLPNGGLILENTLGYYGIGRVLGQPEVGRHYHEEVTAVHPVGMNAQCVQEGLPVITEPEAIYIMNVQEPV